MTTRERDYKHEYEIRLKRNKRLHADMNKEKAEKFLGILEARGVTFIKWLENQIDMEIEKDL